MLLKNGNLYLDSELYETYFNSINAVVLLRKESKFLLIPVQQAGGGLLLKIRNAKGDRVVHAVEFFQSHGVDLDKKITIDVEWDTSFSALTFEIND